MTPARQVCPMYFTVLEKNAFISFKVKILCRVSRSSYVVVLFVAEEILDDGVGLLLESSGDSLDDDSELFSEFDECRKVRAPFCYLLERRREKSDSTCFM